MKIKNVNSSINFFICMSVLWIFIFSSTPCFAQEKVATQNESDSTHYLIGPNDVLNIFVWKEADLTRDITVMPDGRITYPLVGEIDVSGQTVTSLKEKITEKLKNFLSSPEITVIVRESKSRQIYTLGKIARPGQLQLAPSMTVLQALSAAGGCTEWADTKNIMIIRRTNGKETTFRFNYQDIISGKNMEQNIILEPNDTIVVP
jgi:polysaccharide biosynthesis/export protein